MLTSLSVIAPSASEPVALDVVRRHVRVDHTADDDLLLAYLSAAREWAENYLSRPLTAKQYRWIVSQDVPNSAYSYVGVPLSLFVFPQWFNWEGIGSRALSLPMQPVESVDAVSTGQWGQEDAQLVAGTDYDADVSSGLIRFKGGGSAYVNNGQDHMTVDFTAGQIVSPQINAALLLMTAFLYEQRGDAGGDPPTAAKMLLTPYRLVYFG